MAEAFDPTKAPLAIRQAITKALGECREIVRSNALANLDRVLRRRSGALASSVYARVRQTQFGGYLQVGTPLYYGRFWEYGFLRGANLIRGRQRRRIRRTATLITELIQGGAKLYRRPWLQPAVDAAQAEIVRRVETHVAAAVKDQFKSTTIDIEIGYGKK